MDDALLPGLRFAQTHDLSQGEIAVLLAVHDIRSAELPAPADGVVRPPLKHQDIATAIGRVRAHVSRIIALLKVKRLLKQGARLDLA